MNRTSTDAIVLHTTATAFGKTETVESIKKMHLDRGFVDIGYHYLIGLQGEIWPGRKPLRSQGAHVRGFNQTTLGVSYVGGLDPSGKAFDTRSQAQKDSQVYLLKKLLKIYPRAVILGHRDLSPDMNDDGKISRNEWVKECPCFDAGAWAKSVGLPGAVYLLGKYVLL